MPVLGTCQFGIILALDDPVQDLRLQYLVPHFLAISLKFISSPKTDVNNNSYKNHGHIRQFVTLFSLCTMSAPTDRKPPISPNSNDTSLNRVKNLPGYTTLVFKGKDEQRALVEIDVATKVKLHFFTNTRLRSTRIFLKGFIPRELVAGEVNWFYTNLGIDDTYFANESRNVISDHIIALFGAKIMAYTKHDPSKLVIDLEKIDEKGAVFIHTSPPGLTTTEGPGATCESRYVESSPFRLLITGSTLG